MQLTHADFLCQPHKKAMNKNELITKVREQDSLTLEEKSQLIDLINRKRYGLVWEDKPEDVEGILNENLPVLSEVTDKAIIYNPEKQNNKTLFENSKDEIPNHILIEGDNLYALTSLCFTHENKIDVIYIDPPYNTGNKDFKYNDSFVDKEDSYRHSKWISFITKRLKIAKKLLKDDGVFFTSIGDDEFAQLKILCDEIFGENNFLANIVRKSKETSNKGRYFSPSTDYVLTYTKNISQLSEFFDTEAQQKEKYIKLFKNEDERGKYNIVSLYMPSLDQRPNQRYFIKCPDGTKVITPTPDKMFRWIPTTFEKNLKDNRVVFLETKTSPLIDEKGKQAKWNIYTKIYLHERQDVGTKPLTFVDIPNSLGSKELIRMNLDFSFSKPKELIKYLISILNKSNDIIILDFFAGSGTTLQATMELNEKDEGTRQCILVTNNENKICEEITYVRNKKVIKGYTKPNGEKVEGLTKNNFRYYKTTLVGREKTLKNKRQVTELATDLLCVKENCYKEIKGAKQIRIFQENFISIVIIYEDVVIPNAIELIKKLPKENIIKVYVFSEGQDPYTEDFEEVLDRVQLCALPDAIYKAYQNILPKKRKVETEIEAVN